MRLALILAAAGSLAAAPALAQDDLAPPKRQPQAEGIESETYEWNRPTALQTAALEARADLASGRVLYRERCAACHLPDGHGLPDGTWPQLAAQHRSVLIKQIVDIVEGRRDNPLMYPYARELADPQNLADVALYVSLLKLPANNGKGPGTDLERGRDLYLRDCVRCHGSRGEGDAESYYPVLAGQHYAYLLRQIRNIGREARRNSHPEMADLVREYSEDEMRAVVDYLSRLSWPERQASD